MSLLYTSTCFEHNCSHHQEVKIVSHSIWHHHTETSEWSKVTKIQFYRYKHIVVKFMCEFFRCDYHIFLHYKHVTPYGGYIYPFVKVIKKVLCLFTFYICWVCLVIKSYKLLFDCCIHKVTYIRLLKLLKISDVCFHYLSKKVSLIIKTVWCLFALY